jgi:hypothetical protein
MFKSNNNEILQIANKNYMFNLKLLDSKNSMSFLMSFFSIFAPVIFLFFIIPTFLFIKISKKYNSEKK